MYYLDKDFWDHDVNACFISLHCSPEAVNCEVRQQYLLCSKSASYELKTMPIHGFKSFRKVPLRLVLVVPFVLQISAAVGLVGYLSFKNGQQAVNDLAHQLMSKVSGLVDQHLDPGAGAIRT